MNVERGSPNQRGMVQTEADKFADSVTHLEPDPEQGDQSSSDDGQSA